jgi:arsenate reductase (glutaredoxin)
LPAQCIAHIIDISSLLNSRKLMPRKAAPADYTIYHNPRCTKSRATLALLNERGIQPNIIEYLNTPPTAKELKGIVSKLGIKPEELVRKGEDVYKEKFSGKTLSDAQWIQALAANPILIERPIVVRGDKAVIGRPPENVEKLLG